MPSVSLGFEKTHGVESLDLNRVNPNPTEIEEISHLDLSQIGFTPLTFLVDSNPVKQVAELSDHTTIP